MENTPAEYLGSRPLEVLLHFKPRSACTRALQLWSRTMIDATARDAPQSGRGGLRKERGSAWNNLGRRSGVTTRRVLTPLARARRDRRRLPGASPQRPASPPHSRVHDLSDLAPSAQQATARLTRALMADVARRSCRDNQPRSHRPSLRRSLRSRTPPSPQSAGALFSVCTSGVL